MAIKCKSFNTDLLAIIFLCHMHRGKKKATFKDSEVQRYFSH